MRFLTFVFILSSQLLADTNETLQNKLYDLEKEEKRIDYVLESDSIWLKSYSNYSLYVEIKNELHTILNRIQNGEKAVSLFTERDSLQKQLLLFGEIHTPFGKLLNPPKLETAQIVSNPFHIFTSLSHINQNIQHQNDFQKRIEDFKYIFDSLENKIEILEERKDLIGIESENYYLLVQQKAIFQSAYKELQRTGEILKKRIDEVNLEIESQVISQIKAVFDLIIILAVIVGVSFALKILSGKYLKDNQRIYMSNKAINFITVTIIVFTLTFTYIDNIDYLITILGFASAGLAIAMKDGFMSMFAWFVIIFGGSIKAGDRIKVTIGGAEYVGDILDISLLRITLHEDVTLTSYDVNRRAGRIIFVPNNYIFTNLLVNYSHYTLRTVWDGIDIMITFDSNHKKAMHLVKEIAKNYSAGYTDMTRKQLNNLRDRYNLRNSNVEPRIFSFIGDYGIKISVWYLTNAYATLALRSNISSKIVDSFNSEEDIEIAYPTQFVKVDRLANSILVE
jgi:small-conductance mechanosensitive channel